MQFLNLKNSGDLNFKISNIWNVQSIDLMRYKIDEQKMELVLYNRNNFFNLFILIYWKKSFWHKNSNTKTISSLYNKHLRIIPIFHTACPLGKLSFGQMTFGWLSRHLHIISKHLFIYIDALKAISQLELLNQLFWVSIL
jgi:hypothetical protein